MRKSKQLFFLLGVLLFPMTVFADSTDATLTFEGGGVEENTKFPEELQGTGNPEKTGTITHSKKQTALPATGETVLPFLTIAGYLLLGIFLLLFLKRGKGEKDEN
ncbi:MAG: LPXTG cell wall anchor domain-containing protein [Lactobacillales bacterium]|jgi:LPXTG-motif cell wall-anchored protein|nr:LPXTG cell wall anchor domain-containing protein [Lactobacillales bacterium]